MEEDKEQSKTEDNRPSHLFKPGVSGNPNGRPPETDEEKLKKQVLKKITEEYRNALTAALPTISPVLVGMAQKGDIAAIKEVHDRVMGKAPQDITSGGEKINPIPILNALPKHNSNPENNSPEQKD